MAQPPFARVWLAQRLAADAALTEVHDAELRALTGEEALRRTDALLALCRVAPLPKDRRGSSGLVEQQALFARARRR